MGTERLRWWKRSSATSKLNSANQSNQWGGSLSVSQAKLGAPDVTIQSTRQASSSLAGMGELCQSSAARSAPGRPGGSTEVHACDNVSYRKHKFTLILLLYPPL